MANSKSWREIRSALALNETRVDMHRRLMDAQLQIAESLLKRRVVSEEQVDGALSASQDDGLGTGAEDGIYLSSLARYVSALGGHLELRAVFPGETVTVMRTDAPTPPQST